jgi:hypothetical protein
MTTKRLIDATSEASELERKVLASGLDAEPPPGAEQAVWRTLAAGLVPPGVPDAASAPVAPPAASAAAAAKLSGTATLVALGKGFALGVGVSLAAAGVGRFERAPAKEVEPAVAAPVARDTPAVAAPQQVNPHPELPETPESPVVARFSGTPPVASSSAEPTLPLATATVPSSPVEARGPGSSSVAAFPLADGQAASRASRLEEEAAMLRRARAELRGGRLAEAFATLEASRERFSLPELAQEREALLIELLYRSGQRASAGEKARSFLSRYPESPHAAKVRSIAGAQP